MNRKERQDANEWGGPKAVPHYERPVDHASRKIVFEGLLTYAVIACCFGVIIWAILGFSSDLFATINAALGG